MDTTGIVLTERGKDLMARAQAGTLIKFSHIEYGSGVWEDSVNVEQVENLTNAKLSLPIQEIKAPGNGTVVLTAAFTNSGLVEGFYHTETGIYAEDPIHGKILYALHYSSNGSYIAAGGTAFLVEDVTDYVVVVGNAQNVAATINNMVILATKRDIGDHNTDPEAHSAMFDRLATGTPSIISPENGAVDVGETPLFLFSQWRRVFAEDELDAIQFQLDKVEDNFASPAHDTGWLTTIASGYELPPDILQAGRSGYKGRVRWRLKNGLISPWSGVPTFTTREVFNYVNRPTNVFPASGATDVQECPEFECGPFSVVGDVADTHKSTQLRVRQGDTIIHLSPVLGPVLKYQLSPSLHQISNDYVYEFRHEGDILGWGDWGVATPYHTVSAFITEDDAAFFNAWVEYLRASSAGVAQSDDAILKSNMVDQGSSEPDWTDVNVQVKIRNPKALPLDTAKTTAKKMVVFQKPPLQSTILTERGSVVVDTVNDEGSLPVQTSVGGYSALGCSATHFVQGNGNGVVLIDRITGEQQIINDTAMSVAAMSYDGSIIAANKYGGGPAILSLDSGATWQTFDSSNPAYIVGWLCSVSPDGNKIAFCGYGSSQIMLSTDRGQSWAKKDISGATARHLQITDSAIVISAYGGNTVVRSFDWGQSWETVFNGEWFCLAAGPMVNGRDVMALGRQTNTNGSAADLTEYGWCYIDTPANAPVVIAGKIGEPEIVEFQTNNPTAKLGRYTTIREGILFTAINNKIYSLRLPVATGDQWFQAKAFSIVTAFDAAPTQAFYHNHKLAVATGGAGASFTDEDFNEVDIAESTIVVDSDTVHPEAIVVKSVKHIPTQNFRRMQFRVEKLDKETEVRIGECQANLNKLGA